MPDKDESYESRPGGRLKNSPGSAGPPRQVSRCSPVTTVIAASVLTIVLLMGLGWQVWRSYLDHEGTRRQAFPIQALRDQIIHFDEVLTMSANMAAATGDPQWEQRYRQFEPRLDVAIKTLKRLVPKTFDSAAAIQTDEANVKRVEMENQVFELVGWKRLDEAQAILSSDDYRERKKLYSDGMERIAADLEDHITVDLESHRKSALIAVVSVLLGLPLLALIWLWVLQNMRRHLMERDQAEQALKESEEKYRGFMEASPDATAMINEDGQIVMVNSRMEEMFGYSRQELLGKVVETLVPERSRDIYLKHRARFSADPVPRPMGTGRELYALCKDGTELPVDISLGPLQTEGGLLVAVSIRDITESLQRERLLKENEQKFRAVFNNTFEFMGILTTDGVLVEANQTALDFGGVKESDVLGKLFWETPWWEHSSQEREWLRDAVSKAAAGEFVRDEANNIGPDGTIHYIDISITPVRDDQGNVTFLVPEGRDITQRKLAEDALKESEARYRSLTDDVLDSSELGSLILDADFKVAWINRAIESFLGVQQDQVIGKDMRELIRTQISGIFEKPQEFMDKVISTYDNNTNVERFECHVLGDGTTEERWLEHRSLPIQSGLYAGGRMEHYIDISQRKQVEERLKESEKRSRAWLENSPVCTKILDLDFNLQYMSRAGIDGLKIDDITEFYGKPFPLYFYPDLARHSMTKCLEKVRETGEIVTGETSLFDLEGNELWFYATFVPVKNDEGQIEYIIVVSVDTTKRKQAERTLQESEDRFKDFFANAPIGFHIFGPNQVITDINDAEVDMIGYTRDEIVGKKTWADLIIPAQAEQFKKHWNDIITKGNIRNLEYTLVHKLGHHIEVLLNASSRFDETGQFINSRGSILNITERKRSEEDLIASEMRFRAIFQQAYQFSVLIDTQGQVIEVNNLCYEATGLAEEQVVGCPFQELLWWKANAETQKDVIQDMQIAINGNIANRETVFLNEKNEERIVDRTISPVYDENGKVIFLLAQGLDITERKRAEEQIENLARFPSENPNPVMRIARDGTLLYANDASESILEKWACREGEAVPDEWCRITSEVFDAREGKRIEREYAGRVLSFMITPVVEAGYANLYCRDTTERKRAEESLELQLDLEELLTSVSTEFINLEPDEIDDAIERALETIADVACVDRAYIFLYSPDGDMMSNTHEFCRIGVPPYKDRLQDVPVSTFPWFNARIGRFETVAVDSIATLTEEADTEKEEWLHEGIQSLVCVPMISRDHLIGFVGFDAVLYETQWGEEIITFLKILGTVFANTLDRKQAGQERQRLLKTLAAKNEELQSIVYVASHDLKSPLVNIEGFSGELAVACEQVEAVLHADKTVAEIQRDLATVLDEDIPESISFIRSGTLKMQALLKGLLEVSRTGTASIEIEAIDVNGMMDLIITGMQFQITSSGVDVTVDDLPDCIGDKDHVNQVFTNLLNNAVKYLDPNRKGLIHVWGRVEGGDSIYCVEDNGLGIAPAHQPKVFELFHRLEPTGEIKGEGLGLTIARRILGREGGRIWVESEPGKGSRFFVSLPTA